MAVLLVRALGVGKPERQDKEKNIRLGVLEIHGRLRAISASIYGVYTDRTATCTMAWLSLKAKGLHLQILQAELASFQDSQERCIVLVIFHST